MRKLVFFSLIILCISVDVQANAIVQSEEQGVRFIYPIKTENVEVLSQNISYDITIQSEDSIDSTQAVVTTDYMLKNTSDSLQKIMLVVPLIHENDNLIKVVFDDKNILKETLHVKGLHFAHNGWYTDDSTSLSLTEIEKMIMDAKNNLNIINPLQSIGMGIRIVLFTVELHPQETHKLQISYNEYPIFQKDPWSKKWTPKFLYDLNSGSNWEIRNELKLAIRVPNNYIITESSLSKLTSQSKGMYSGSYKGIPIEKLSFLVKDKPKIVQLDFGQYTSKEFMTFLAAFAGIISITLLIAVVIDHKNW